MKENAEQTPQYIKDLANFVATYKNNNGGLGFVGEKLIEMIYSVYILGVMDGRSEGSDRQG